jgi:hypothetical protein
LAGILNFKPRAFSQLWPLALLAAMLASGCSTPRAQLSRCQDAFDQNQHERALAVARQLEDDLPRLEPAERARYAYIRGMTDHRIGYDLEARHWLIIADAMEKQFPGSLPTEWTAKLAETLTPLNEAVYRDGNEALRNRSALAH